jgi:hypothetical protein
MLRSTSFLTALMVAAVAPAQSSLLRRIDSVPDSVQLTLSTQSRTSAGPNTAFASIPNQSAPNYNFGYAITGPTVGARRAVVSNEVYNKNVFSNRDILMSFTGVADNHVFQLPDDQPFSLVGPVQFTARYNATGIWQRDVVFSARPTARVVGPTANLQATLSTSRIGLFSKPRFNVTGFIINQSGVNNVNLVSPVNGIIFNTFLTGPLPRTFSIPVTRMTIPSNRLTTPPRATTSTEFRTSYNLRLQ